LGDVVADNGKQVASFEAESRGRKIVVFVGINGASAGVRLHDRALETSDEELASRIVCLNTLAYLRWQLVQSQELNRPNRARGRGIFPSQAQVAAYAELIDLWESRVVSV
jgi:hypothetical protein